MDDMDKREGLWALVTTAGGSYIGKVSSYAGADSKNTALDKVADGAPITLYKAYEYHSGPSRDRQGAYCQYPFNVRLILKVIVTGIAFLNDLEEEDRDFIFKLLDEADRCAKVRE